jgi:hypothetical protein
MFDAAYRVRGLTEAHSGAEPATISEYAQTVGRLGDTIPAEVPAPMNHSHGFGVL